MSGQVPEEPVISPVSGSVFERRLIVKHIDDQGTDPVSGDALSADQLVAVKSKKIDQTFFPSFSLPFSLPFPFYTVPVFTVGSSRRHTLAYGGCSSVRGSRTEYGWVFSKSCCPARVPPLLSLSICPSRTAVWLRVRFLVRYAAVTLGNGRENPCRTRAVPRSSCPCFSPSLFGYRKFFKTLTLIGTPRTVNQMHLYSIGNCSAACSRRHLHPRFDPPRGSCRQNCARGP